MGFDARWTRNVNHPMVPVHYHDDPEYYRRQAEEGWPLWRLILEGGMDKETVFQMDVEELHTANAALDILIEVRSGKFKRISGSGDEDDLDDLDD